MDTTITHQYLHTTLEYSACLAQGKVLTDTLDLYTCQVGEAFEGGLSFGLPRLLDKLSVGLSRPNALQFVEASNEGQ